MGYRKKTRRINKVIKIGLIAVVVLIGLALLWFFIIRGFLNYFLPTPFRETDTNAYLNGDYKEYNGGDLAGECFPEPEDLGDYEGIKFLFANNWWKSDPFERAGNSFMLDVTYSQEQYDVITQKLIEVYGLKNKISGTNEYSYSISAYMINDEEEIEFRKSNLVKDNGDGGNNDVYNIFIIMFFDNSKTVRFAFIEKQSGSFNRKRESLDLGFYRYTPEYDLDYLRTKYLG